MVEKFYQFWGTAKASLLASKIHVQTLVLIAHVDPAKTHISLCICSLQSHQPLLCTLCNANITKLFHVDSKYSVQADLSLRSPHMPYSLFYPAPLLMILSFWTGRSGQTVWSGSTLFVILFPHLRNSFHFSEVHRSMNAMGPVQSKCLWASH